ncbi:hypothetical protein [Streptomyces avermitilis]|uniref:hypothetical protein n=1 Tax=Streptomyces avermitilis TaxID=33903 RepID=UPI003F53E728
MTKKQRLCAYGTPRISSGRPYSVLTVAMAEAGDAQEVEGAGHMADGRHASMRPAIRPAGQRVPVAGQSGPGVAAEPLLAVLMLGRPGFTPWQYGLAFAVPSVGCSVRGWPDRSSPGSGRSRSWWVVAGALRALWTVGLAFLGPGTGGLLLVMGVELGLIFSCGVFNPVRATCACSCRRPRRAAAPVVETESAPGRA